MPSSFDPTSQLWELAVAGAAVPHTATFRDAADTLCTSGLSAVAVIDGERRVLGLFTEDDFLAGMFPRYLADLHHTAFTPVRLDAVTAAARAAAGESVERHMRPAVTVDVDSSPLHVAEVFLHCEWGAVAVVREHRLVGMLAQVAFCRQLLPALDT